MPISEVPFKKDIDCSREINQSDDCEMQYSTISEQVRQGNNRRPVIKYVKGIINLFYCSPNWKE